ncbi:MAG TPA: hypothetical protein VFL85_00385 [Candidatus Saccharimonadales bacterium]|nr:hypothetical protein [Candidatus Saccharimonadales bacterium]
MRALAFSTEHFSMPNGNSVPWNTPIGAQQYLQQSQQELAAVFAQVHTAEERVSAMQEQNWTQQAQLLFEGPATRSEVADAFASARGELSAAQADCDRIATYRVMAKEAIRSVVQ